jgi:hypothetical protein
MTPQEQEAAVEHLTRLLERDRLGVDEYRDLVDRVLATSTSIELASVLGPYAPTSPSLVIECRDGVVKEVPTRLPEAVEIRCEKGVLKVDLSKAEIESSITDVEIETLTGVVKVIFPRDAIIEIGDHVANGGVFSNRIRAVKAEAWRPRIVVHIRNDGAVLKIKRARR